MDDSMIPDKDETITALEHLLAEKQAEIEGLQIIVKELERRLDHAEWLVARYRQDNEV